MPPLDTFRKLLAGESGFDHPARESPMPPPSLCLDHVSLQVHDMGQAIRQLHDRLGLEPRLGEEDPRHHGRIHFDRTYVELAVPYGNAQAAPAWKLPWFFLSFSEPLGALRGHLDGAGLAHTLQVFDGDDGFWTEIRLEVPPSTPSPLLLSRSPEFQARAFSPRARVAQPCGAFQLAGVAVVTPELDATADFYRRLLGLQKVAAPYQDRFFSARRVDLPLAGGRLALIQPERAGFAQDYLAARGPGPLAMQLAIESFWPMEEQVERLGIRYVRGITPRGAELWLDPGETFGVPFGFVEELPPLT